MRLRLALQALSALASFALFSSLSANAGVSMQAAPPAPATEVTSLDERSDLSDRIDAYLAQHHAIDQLSGAVLVADRGEVVYRGAFGMANSDWDIPNAVDTKFRLASITKQFTALLVLLLAEEGALELEAPLTRYLPDYPAESGDRVTLRHLLNHTSGIPSYTDRPGFLRNEGKVHLEVADFVAEYCSDPLEFEPGTQYRYNNSGYYLLGAIVEVVTGQTYRQALRERIFEPLGMGDTDHDDQYEVVPGRAVGYDDLLGSRRVAMWMEMSVPFAAGGLYSTVDDLWKWDRALAEQRLLGGELEREMFTPGLGDYGFGWEIDALDSGSTVLSHGGGMPGVSTMIWRVPEQGRCVIVLGNTMSTHGYDALRGITALLNGEEPGPVYARGDFHLARIVLDEGADAGLASFAAMPQVVRDEYIERDVNAIGYRLIEHDRLADAIALFEFLTRAYPDSANVLDSLGEAHLLAGERERAAEYYGRALELDPDSATVPAILEQLQQD